MKKEISYKECLGAVEHQLTNGGAFLITADGKRVNVMTIGWGGINYYWKRPVFIVPVRQSRYTKEILNKNGAGKYIFTAYVKTYENSPSVGNPYSMIIRIQDEDAESKTYKKANFSMTDKWQKITLETTLEFNTLEDGLVYFEGSDEKDLNDYYIDLCSMTKVE